MTACDARARLARLIVERPGAGTVPDPAGAADIAACRDALVGLAVTEIASFRAQLSGPQVG